MTRPRLLDLFCGAGGCSVGYHRAGFDVVGVDIEPHPDYPYELTVADAMTVLADVDYLDSFDVVAASPPCQAYSVIGSLHDKEHPDLVAPVRDALLAWGGTYVIENVPGAPLDHPALYCGAAFNLGALCRDGRYRALKRHRIFESNVFLMTPGCACGAREVVGVYGHGGSGTPELLGQRHGYQATKAEASEALGIDWMRQEDLAQAIPPVYCEHIGAQLLEALSAAA